MELLWLGDKNAEKKGTEMHILSIPGGGAAGLGVVSYLAHLERQLGGTLQDHFDMFVGVSTGAIISAGLGNRMSAEQLYQFYNKHLPSIFKRSWFMSGVLRSAKYKSEYLSDALREVFPLSWDQLPLDTMTFAAEVEPFLQPRHWKSWEPSSVPVADVLLASAAAPTYFKPHRIGGSVYVDGAVVDLDPTLHAVAEAVRRGVELSDVRVLTVSPYGIQHGFQNAEKVRSSLAWASKLPAAFVENSGAAQRYHARQLLGARAVHVGIDATSSMDDVSEAALAALQIRGRQLAADATLSSRVLATFARK